MTTRVETRNRIAVVTGASGGVGRATAIAFAERGFDVALLPAVGRGSRRPRTTGACRRASAFCPVDVASTTPSMPPRLESNRSSVRSRVGEQRDDDGVLSVRRGLAGQVQARGGGDVPRPSLGNQGGARSDATRDRGSIVNVGSALAFMGIPLQCPTARRSSRAAASSSRYAPSSFTSTARFA